MSAQLREILRNSKLFALPPKISNSKGAAYHPTSQLITAPRSTRKHGEWGLKSKLPLRSKFLRSGRTIVEELEAPEGMATFYPGEQYFKARLRFQYLNAPISASRAMVERMEDIEKRNKEHLESLAKAEKETESEDKASEAKEPEARDEHEHTTESELILEPGQKKVDTFQLVANTLKSSNFSSVLDKLTTTKQANKTAIYCQDAEVAVRDEDLRTQPLVPGAAPLRLGELTPHQLRQYKALAMQRRSAFDRYLQKHGVSLNQANKKWLLEKIKTLAHGYLGIASTDAYSDPISGTGGLGYALRGRAFNIPERLVFGAVVNGRDLSTVNRSKLVAVGGFVASTSSSQVGDKLQDAAGRFNVSSYKTSIVTFSNLGNAMIQLSPINVNRFEQSRIFSPGVDLRPYKVFMEYQVPSNAADGQTNKEDDLDEIYESMIRDV